MKLAFPLHLNWLLMVRLVQDGSAGVTSGDLAVRLSESAFGSGLSKGQRALENIPNRGSNIQFLRPHTNTSPPVWRDCGGLRVLRARDCDLLRRATAGGVCRPTGHPEGSRNRAPRLPVFPLPGIARCAAAEQPRRDVPSNPDAGGIPFSHLGG